MSVPLDRTEVEPITKEAQTGRVWNCKANSDGCTYKEPCRSCLGRRNRRKGLRAQQKARKALNIPTSKWAAKNTNEETWDDPYWRNEVKSGGQINPVANAFMKAEKQSEASRAIGDNRPFRLITNPTGWGGEGLVTVRWTTWAKHIEPRFTEET